MFVKKAGYCYDVCVINQNETLLLGCLRIEGKERKMVKRIYVEKKKGFDVEAAGLLSDLSENLHLGGLKRVRLINRYDIEGIDEAIYEASKHTVFSEPAVDSVYSEDVLDQELGGFSGDDQVRYFSVSYLPGQYDQRADSAAQCIELISMGQRPIVKCARRILLYGQISSEEFDAIKKYCINPVDSHEESEEKLDSLILDMPSPADVARVEGFRAMAPPDLSNYRNSGCFAMSLEDMTFVQNYFNETELREPTITELRVIDTYWSDHCRHTTFLTQITKVDFEDGRFTALFKSAYQDYLDMRQSLYKDKNKDISLMDLAVIGAKYLKDKGLVPDLDESDEINACSIKVKAMVDGAEEDWLVMFKNETHNHPTEIEPFGGAATCLGGAIRDPLSGRVYVYQAMRVTGSGDPRTRIEDTLPGKLPTRKITREAASGYSSYGNQIGLATGQVSEIYHEGYVAKRMEVGAVIGAAPARNVRREKPVPGDVIILLGGRTGRDGCGGATGSSKEHTEDSILNCGAEVQKGNPPVERNIQRLFRREEATRLIKKCNDFGAGGISVAIGELADSIDTNLDLVLKKYEGLDGTELAISESQERMAVVVSEEDSLIFISLAESENLEAVAVAKVTDTGRFRLYWRGSCILDLSREFLNTNGIKQTAEVLIDCKSEPDKDDQTDLFEQNLFAKHHEFGDPEAISLQEQWRNMLKNLNCASQKGLVERFDSTIGAGTILMPLGGKYQLTPQVGMAAKLPVLSGDTDTVTLMSYGFDPDLSSASPFHGALYAVVDSVTKLAALGGDYSKARLSFQEYFEKLGTSPDKWGKPFIALLGALKAQKELGIPAIGGKDSMSGTFMERHVPPTLISFAVGTTSAGQVISSEFKKPGNKLMIIFAGMDHDKMIDFKQYMKNMTAVKKLIEKGIILSASTIGKGGIAAAISKMSFGNKIGASLENLKREQIFEPMYGALIVEIKNLENLNENLNRNLNRNLNENLEELLEGTVYETIGKTRKEAKISILNTEFDLEQLLKVWSHPLESIFPTKADETKTKEEVPPLIQYYQRSELKPKASFAKPRVSIFAFPGTNCEMDSKRAFEKAGAKADIMILKNLTPMQLDASIKEMALMIKNSQILMLPGGFSGGDEPDGSAKFITAVFRNPVIKQATLELINNRDGLILGICNGFQALIKLGLVPYGNIIDADEGSPTLTYNNIGRHMSRLVRTRIASVKSPWLSQVNMGDEHLIPVSHGEGRFVASSQLLDAMNRNGQIASQYIDYCGNPSMDIAHNPNNSIWAIEGITSQDGRIFGKMGHSERIGKNLYKNVPGEMDQKLFEAGVAYFK